MTTLIIYDNVGNIYYQASGSVVEPQGGLQYLMVEVPEGKRIVSVDTSTDPHTVIFEDIPQTEIEELKDENAALLAKIEYLALMTDVELSEV